MSNQCEIRANNTAANDPCAFCGERTDPQIPLAIFKYGTYEPVCDRCASEHNPTSYEAMMNFYDHDRYLEAQIEYAKEEVKNIGLLIGRVLPLLKLHRIDQAKTELQEIMEIIDGARTINGETAEAPF